MIDLRWLIVYAILMHDCLDAVSHNYQYYCGSCLDSVSSLRQCNVKGKL